MILFGLMQFINSPSPWISFASGSTTGICLGLLLFWWRKTGGATWSMRELLPHGLSFGWMTGLLALFLLISGVGRSARNPAADLAGPKDLHLVALCRVDNAAGAVCRVVYETGWGRRPGGKPAADFPFHLAGVYWLYAVSALW